MKKLLLLIALISSACYGQKTRAQFITKVSGLGNYNIAIQKGFWDTLALSVPFYEHFNASDFNVSGANILLDYTNGQAASGSLKGFLTATDWTTFNNKGSVNSVNGTLNRITSTGGSTPVIDLSATFEALLGKVANRIDQNNASTTSAQLATTISDETGTGVVVYSTSPALTGIPTVPTAAGGTNTTQVASTAFVTAAVSGGGLSGTGFPSFNGSSPTYRAITGTTDQVTVTNGNGVSGAPTISLPSTLILPNGATATTQAALDGSTKVATDAYADRAAGQFTLKGQVINETFASSFANYTSTGTATWSIVGGALQGVGGSSFDLGSYVSHSAWGNTAIRNSSQSIEVTVGTLSATSQGAQLSLFGKGAGGQNSTNFVLRLNTARQGFLECYINNSSALVGGDDFFHASTTALTVAAGDHVKLVLDIVENEYIFRATNLTQTSVQPVALTVTTSPVVRTQWANYSTIQFGFGVVGGTHSFDNHIVNVNEPVSPDILIAGNSIATGAGVINVEQSFPKQLEGLSGLKVMRWSGGGNVARDLRGADILRYTPRIVIIDIGINDIITSRTSGQVITDINQIITDLGGGYTLGVNLFVCEVLPYTTFSSQVQTYNTAYQTNYAAGLIRWYQSFNNGSGGMQTTLVNADLLHPNFLGHKLAANYIYQEFRDRGIITATAKPKSNQSQVYSYDNRLGIGSSTPFTPTYALQSISNKQQFIVGNDATNPTYGGGMVSTSATHMSIRSGMVFDGSNNISTGTAGQSEIVLQDGKVTFRSNNSIAAGSSVGTMNPYFTMLNTGLIGLGVSTTNPLSQLHISADATTSQGILSEVHVSAQGANSFVLRKSRGSIGSPTTVIDTDYGSTIVSDQYSGSSYLRTVSLGTRVNGTVTTSSVPTDFFIATSATGTTDPYTNGTIKFLVSSAGNVGIGTTAPTAKLHLPAGTTAASTAPLKLITGPLMTSPEAGAIEFLTDKTYFTIGTGTARKEFTLNDAALTSGSYPVATTNGRLTDSKVTAGSFSGAGTATTVFTVTIGVTMANSTYKVQVTPTSSLSAALFFVTNKTATTFDVTYLAGLTGTVTFDWLVFP